MFFFFHLLFNDVLKIKMLPNAAFFVSFRCFLPCLRPILVINKPQQVSEEDICMWEKNIIYLFYYCFQYDLIIPNYVYYWLGIIK